jgi:hypothetical protein
MLNIYRHFLPACAHILRPLTDLLRGKHKTLEWTALAEEAFQGAKCLLAAPVLPSLSTDASESHIGGMQQKLGVHWRPLGFFSRKLSEMESCYYTFGWELLAAHLSICYFRHFCEGCLVQLWMHHEPLVTALSRVTAPISPCQQRHLVFISEFNVQMLYLPGFQNVVAVFCHALPRCPS